MSATGRQRIGRLVLGDVLHSAASCFGTRAALVEGARMSTDLSRLKFCIYAMAPMSKPLLLPGRLAQCGPYDR